jgi:hypothetical protein
MPEHEFSDCVRKTKVPLSFSGLRKRLTKTITTKWKKKKKKTDHHPRDCFFSQRVVGGENFNHLQTFWILRSICLQEKFFHLFTEVL